jgi:succinylarginine dihydrolase
MKSLIRLRMSTQDAHYGGNLVDGARMLGLFGDVATELLIRNDGDEGLFVAYDNVEFLAPVFNEEEMSLNRYNKPLKELTRYQIKNLSNGPGKLCMALRISVKDNGTDLTGDEIYVEDDGFRDFKTERSKRINIDYAEEAKDFLWRYTIQYK